MKRVILGPPLPGLPTEIWPKTRSVCDAAHLFKFARPWDFIHKVTAPYTHTDGGCEIQVGAPWEPRPYGSNDPSLLAASR